MAKTSELTKPKTSAFYLCYPPSFVDAELFIYWAADQRAEIPAMMNKIGIRDCYIQQYLDGTNVYGECECSNIVHPEDRLRSFASATYMSYKYDGKEQMGYKFFIGFSPLNNDVGVWAHEATHAAISLIKEAYYSPINDDTEETICRIVQAVTNRISEAWQQYEKSPQFKQHKAYMDYLKKKAAREAKDWNWQQKP